MNVTTLASTFDPREIGMSDGWMAGLICAAIALVFLTATWFVWRRQERDRPQDNFRGGPFRRYLKTVLSGIGDGFVLWL